MAALDDLRHVPLPGLDAATAREIPTGTRGDLVWGPVRHAYLAWRAMSDGETHLKSARQWEPARYVPVFVLAPDGRPVLAFEK